LRLASREKDRERRIGQKGYDEDDHRSPNVGLRPEPWVLHEAVGNERERGHGAAENDNSQQSAAWFTGPKTDASRSPDAAETELPPLSPALHLIEFNEHRTSPVHPLSRQTLHCELEQQLSSIAIRSATEQDPQDGRNRECRREDQKRQNEQRAYDAPRSSGRDRLRR
jgi:hypothetical protein